MKTIIAIIILLIFNLHSHSQVTIGSGAEPAQGALLDLKQVSDLTGGENSQKGMLMPRVNLTELTELTDISDVNNSDSGVRLAHTGLTVYNTNPSFEGGLGINIWDGNKWNNYHSQDLSYSYVTAFANTSTSLLAAHIILGTTWQTIPFADVKINSNNEYNSATGVFTVKKKGTYTFSSKVQFNGISIGTIGLAILLKKNGQTNYTVLGFQNGAILSLGTSRSVNLSQALEPNDQIIFAINTPAVGLSLASGDDAYIIIKQQ